MRIGIGSTKGSDWYGYAIRWVTAPGLLRMSPWNHSIVVFDDAPSGCEYFESHWRRDRDTGVTGVRGPLPFTKLQAWAQERTSHAYQIKWLPYGHSIATRGYDVCNRMVGKVGYAHLQLVQNLKRNVLALPSRPWLRSPGRVTCSEFAALIWWLCDPGTPFSPSPLVRLLEIGTRNILDDVTPSGKLGLHEAVSTFTAQSR